MSGEQTPDGRVDRNGVFWFVLGGILGGVAVFVVVFFLYFR